MMSDEERKERAEAIGNQFAPELMAELGRRQAVAEREGEDWECWLYGTLGGLLHAAAHHIALLLAGPPKLDTEEKRQPLRDRIEAALREAVGTIMEAEEGRDKPLWPGKHEGSA